MPDGTFSLFGKYRIFATIRNGVAIRLQNADSLPLHSGLVAKEANVPLSILHYYFKDKNEFSAPIQCTMSRTPGSIICEALSLQHAFWK